MLYLLHHTDCRFYGTENLLIIHELPFYAQKVTVWCRVCDDKIIGLFFFEDEAGETVSVNQQRYRDMKSDFFTLTVCDSGMEHFRFQQDGAPLHTARALSNF